MALTSTSRSVLLTLIAFAGTNFSSAETPKGCLGQGTKRALYEVRHVADWKSLFNSFNQFGQCDSGKIAEEYSYALSRLLAHNWSDLDTMFRLAADHPDFKRFILRHLDENIPEEEAQIIIRNSRERCPPGGDWLCSSIVDY